jgi:lysozyme family protein
MTVPSFAALAPSYARLWADLTPMPAHVPALHEICRRLIADKPAYQAVAFSVWLNADYWFIVAVIDQMEGGGGANTYLGNGQSLHHVTTEVPAGRGPFASFHAGAVDALHLGGLDKVTAWPIERIAYESEDWNGWGYLDKPIVDPYLAAWSNLYTKGKWIADHVYDANAVSAQPGALTILKVLMGLDSSIVPDLVPGPTPKPTEIAVTTTAPAAAPAAPAAPSAAGAAVIDYAALAAEIVKLQHNPVAPAPIAAIVAPVAAPAAPQVTLASTLAHLNALLPLAGVVMAAFPETAPYVPAVTVAQKATTAAANVATVISSNPAALPDLLASTLADIAPALAALRPLSTQWPWLATIETIVGNVATALAPPVAQPKGR